MDIARLLFPDFSLIAIGYLVCRYTALDRGVWEPVERLVYYFLFPVLLFHSIVRTPLQFGPAASLISAGLLLGLSGIAMAYAIAHLPGLRAHIDRREHAAAAQVAFRFNSFIGLALAGRLAGEQGLQLIAVLIGVCVPLMNVGAVWPMARHAQTGVVAALVRNPLIIATAGGLVANVLGMRIPGWLEPTATRIGGASLALGLMTAGAGLQVGSLARSRVLSVSLLGIRHALMPLVAFGLILLFRLDPVQAIVLLVFSALPTSTSGYVLAARMGYNGSYVAGLVTVSTMLGVLSLTVVLALAR